MSSCGSSNCGCGSSCSCGSGCNCRSGMELYLGEKTTTPTIVAGFAPVKMNDEMRFGSECDNCKCGSNCSCGDSCSC